ncbi:hypothetical protein AXG93_4085s1220 [Marchantia polymorpha subsp. ruderalis]|uniref:Uncharacterized protein n=1 Tax=Marchantia polymorpha subsp. ruderalis TaxID=1480154 RepID=A0A176WHI5_MARPO|nr:hypothetical protein AXG93_4085s1220 [Marchantia polymorpha subsp. ruderalis]
MMISMAEVFNECFEAWTAEELVKFMELFPDITKQEATSSGDSDREITSSSSSTDSNLVESEEFLRYLEDKIREEYPDQADGLSRDAVFQMGLVKRMEKEYRFDDLSEAMPSEPRTKTRAIWKAAQWASKEIFHLTNGLLLASIIGLGSITTGSLMLAGVIASMATGLSVFFSTSSLRLPFFVSLIPVITVLVAVLLLAALGCVIFGSACFGVFCLLCWIHDYLLGHDPPGARELAELSGRARALLANGLLRLREFARSVAGCCGYIKDMATLLSIKLTQGVGLQHKDFGFRVSSV